MVYDVGVILHGYETPYNSSIRTRTPQQNDDFNVVAACKIATDVEANLPRLAAYIAVTERSVNGHRYGADGPEKNGPVYNALCSCHLNNVLIRHFNGFVPASHCTFRVPFVHASEKIVTPSHAGCRWVCLSPSLAVGPPQRYQYT